jgi:hypothetical protein
MLQLSPTYLAAILVLLAACSRPAAGTRVFPHTLTVGARGVPAHANGAAATARLQFPAFFAEDPLVPNSFILADGAGHRVRKLAMPAGTLSDFVGSGVPGCASGLTTAAQFNNVATVVVLPTGTAYAPSHNAHVVSEITAGGTVTAAWSGVCNTGDDAINGAAATTRYRYPLSLAYLPHRPRQPLRTEGVPADRLVHAYRRLRR